MVTKEELWDLNKDQEEAEKKCHQCFGNKVRKDIDLCYRCAKAKAAKAGVLLTLEEYMEMEA